MDEESYLHALNFCMLLPGPEAQQLATYMGWRLHGTKGGIIAGAFFVLPSIFILLVLSYIYARYGNIREIAGILDGLKPIVVAIVVEAILKIGKRALKGWLQILIAALSFVAIFALHIPFPLIVLGAAIVGLASSKFKVQSLKTPKTQRALNRAINRKSKIQTPADAGGFYHSLAHPVIINRFDLRLAKFADESLSVLYASRFCYFRCSLRGSGLCESGNGQFLRVDYGGAGD
jgi:chromate transport protein ChrA